MLKKKINFRKVEKRVTANNLPLLGNEIIADIVTRTQRGLDINNKSFKPYSKAYKERKAKEYGRSKVNLTQSQKMLNSIRYKKIKDGIRLYFASRQENAKAYGNQVKNKRKFFGVDPKQRAEIKKKLIKLS